LAEDTALTIRFESNLSSLSITSKGVRAMSYNATTARVQPRALRQTFHRKGVKNDFTKWCGDLTAAIGGGSFEPTPTSQSLVVPLPRQRP
jgi:hypothetical protein